MLLCWELGARSVRPKGQTLEDSFTVLYILAFDGAPTAGAASAAWSAISSAHSHLRPDGRASDTSPRARRVMSLAVRLAGCWLGPMARTLATQLALRTSPMQLDGTSTWRTGVRSAGGPLLSIAGAPLECHRYPRTVWMSATRLPARSADRLYWVTASAQASSQIGMRSGMRRRRTRRGAGTKGPKEQTIVMRPGGVRTCRGEIAEVGVAVLVVVASFARTSTSANAEG